MSSFGRLFRITTFGESHCKAVGVIVENMPPRIPLSESDLIPQLQRRRPGQSKINTERDEKDMPIILSGTEQGITLGSPIAVLVHNKDMRPQDYTFNTMYRPSHADYTYWKKYGIHASSGGGRSSARETVARVIGGAIAEKYLLLKHNIQVIAFVSRVGDIESGLVSNDITREEVDKNIIRCPDPIQAEKMIQLVQALKEEGDSIGGVVTCICKNVPLGLGEPCFDKLEALLAHAMLSIPSTKGFEIGSGFEGSKMKGSEHNDEFIWNESQSKIRTKTNRSGGIQGGISNGEMIYFKVAFKPPSTIKKPQNTVDFEGKKSILTGEGRHDPCVVNRAIPIVESMTNLVLMDCLCQF